MANFDLFGIAATSTNSGTPTIILEAPLTTTPIADAATYSCNWLDGAVCERSHFPASPSVAGGLGNPYIFTPGPSSLLSYCQSLFSSSLEAWELTAPITTGTVEPMTTVSVNSPSTQAYWVDLQWSTTVDGTATWTDTTFLSTITDEGLVTWAAFTPYTYVSDFTFVASQPCCLTCTLYGGNVQVFYWPTSTAEFASSAVSTLVDGNGFTFISPSIYVAFSTLYASDLCGMVGPMNQPTTLAFSQNELSTSIDYTWNRTEYSFVTPVFYEVTPEFTPATWGVQTSCSDTTISFWQQINEIGFSGTVFHNVTVTGGYTEQYSDPAEISSIWSSVDMESFRYYTVTYNPCSPLLAVPTAVSSINSLWKACAPGIYALYDPPYVLQPGSGLSVFSTTTNDIQNFPSMTTTQASAGSTPAPVTASMTSTQSATSIPPASIDPPASLPSTSDPAAQPAATTSIDPVAQSSSTNDPPAQQAPSLSTEPLAASPGTNTPNTQASPTYVAPVVSAHAAITIGSSTIIANPSSAFVVASQTLTPGGQIVHSSTTYSLASDGAGLVVGGTSTQIIAASSPPALPSPSYQVGTQVLSVGGAPITVSGSTFSLPPGGSSVIIDGSAQPLSALPSRSPEYLVGSQTLVAGGAAITVSGTTYSLPSGASSVVVGGSTQPIGALLSPSPEYVVGSQTLIDGASAITISGSAVSLQSGGSNVVVGSKTEALSVLLGGSTTVQGIGGIIATIGGFGSQTSASPSMSTASYLQVGGSGYNGTIFVGGGSSLRGFWRTELVIVLVVLIL